VLSLWESLQFSTSRGSGWLVKALFRPFGAGSFRTSTHGLRRGLDSFAAARLCLSGYLFCRCPKNLVVTHTAARLGI